MNQLPFEMTPVMEKILEGGNMKNSEAIARNRIWIGENPVDSREISRSHSGFFLDGERENSLGLIEDFESDADRGGGR
jgi:hypothetical protein